MDGSSQHCIGGSDQDHPQGGKNAKRLSEETLLVDEKRRVTKGKGEKEKYTHLNAEFQIARRDKRAFLTYQCKQR